MLLWQWQLKSQLIFDLTNTCFHYRLYSLYHLDLLQASILSILIDPPSKFWLSQRSCLLSLQHIIFRISLFLFYRSFLRLRFRWNVRCLVCVSVCFCHSITAKRIDRSSWFSQKYSLFRAIYLYVFCSFFMFNPLNKTVAPFLSVFLLTKPRTR